MDLAVIINDLGVLNIIAISAIVFIGLPHGAMDGAVAYRLGWMVNLKKSASFFIVYVLISICVVLFWIKFPVIALIGFLGISMIHFGIGDVHGLDDARVWIEVVAHGGVVICGISMAHMTNVDEIYSALVGGESTRWVWGFIYVTTALTACSLLYCITRFYVNEKWKKTSLELIFLGITFYLLPPLLAFAFYFCFVHSIRHFKNIYSTLNDGLSNKRIYWLTFLFSIITWIVGGLLLALNQGSIEIETQLLRIIFIGLAALTVPHMILIDGWVKPNRLEREYL